MINNILVDSNFTNSNNYNSRSGKKEQIFLPPDFCSQIYHSNIAETNNFFTIRYKIMNACKACSLKLYLHFLRDKLISG